MPMNQTVCAHRWGNRFDRATHEWVTECSKCGKEYARTSEAIAPPTLAVANYTIFPDALRSRKPLSHEQIWGDPE